MPVRIPTSASLTAFTPIDSVFDGAATLPEWYDYLADTERADMDNGVTPATLYVDAATGSDTTGTGTAGSPFASIKRAIQTSAADPLISRIIRLQGAATYTMAGLNLHDLNFITIEGDEPTAASSRTITGVGSSSEANGLTLTDADAAMVVDEHRGRMVKWTSGALSGRYGVVIRNGVNTVEVTQDTSSAFLVPAATDTYDILGDWQTEVTGAGSGWIIESSSGSQFKHVKFVGTQFLYCNDTDKIDFLRCRFEIDGLLAGRGGSLHVTTCSIANRGSAFSDWGMLTSITQGIIRLKRGTLVDAARATSSAVAFVSGLTSGFFETETEIAFRDLGSEGITIRGSGVVSLSARLGSNYSVWRFVDCAGGVLLNASDEGWGWAPADLPALHGNLTSAYTVTATGGARARIASGSTITDTTGTASVSADDGATNVAQDPDGTYIEGGSPAPAGFAPVGGGGGGPPWSVVTEGTASRTAVAGEFILINAATCVVTLPAPAANARVACKVITGTITSIEVRTSGAGIDIDGTDYSSTGLPLSSQWEQINMISDGTDWFIY